MQRLEVSCAVRCIYIYIYIYIHTHIYIYTIYIYTSIGATGLRYTHTHPIISVYSANWLLFITERGCVYCAVRAESLRIIRVLAFEGFGNLLIDK